MQVNTADHRDFTLLTTKILEHPFGKMLRTPVPSQHVKDEMAKLQVSLSLSLLHLCTVLFPSLSAKIRLLALQLPTNRISRTRPGQQGCRCCMDLSSETPR